MQGRNSKNAVFMELVMDLLSEVHSHNSLNDPVIDREGFDAARHGKTRGIALRGKGRKAMLALTALTLVLLCVGCDKHSALPVTPIGKETKTSTVPEPLVLWPPTGPDTPPSETKPNFKPILIHVGKVKVMAEISDFDSEGHYNLQITVAAGRKKYEVDSALTGQENLKTVTQRLNKNIGWKGPYLFVRSECGGGNAFRCDKDYVFKLSGNRLIKIGEIAVWENMPGREKSIGPGYQHGYFRDIWNNLEENDLTSHAEGPSIKMLLQVRDDKFVMNKDQTWKFNLHQYRANEIELRRHAKRNAKSAKSSLELFDLNSQLLFNAALARLTNHKQEYQKTLDLAKLMIDKVGVASFESIISKAFSMHN
jgi:hypothetical protein